MARNFLKGLVSKAEGLLKLVKKPWEITGPTAAPEYLESVPMATEYRVHAPATQLKRAIIPHSEPENVYDIKYYTRDRRRHLVVKEQQVEPSALAAELKDLPPTPGKYFVMGKAYHIDDDPGDGYQK